MPSARSSAAASSSRPGAVTAKRENGAPAPELARRARFLVPPPALPDLGIGQFRDRSDPEFRIRHEVTTRLTCVPDGRVAPGSSS